MAVLIGREPEERYSLHRGYSDALWEAGAVPVLLSPPPGDAGPDRLVDAVLACDGLCVTGGGDVDPAWYGEGDGRMLENIQGVDRLRDQVEMEAMKAVALAGRPVLGICRGVQVMAVAFGGSLHRHLPSAGYHGHWQEDRQYETVHRIETQPGSTAAAVLGPTLEVNSIHHQAVADPGSCLTVSARSDDGVIEALEAPGMLGVQWHPERLYRRDPAHMAVFRWLLNV